MFNKIKSNSALIDTRPDAEKRKDYTTDEIAGSSSITPFKHDKITELSANVYDQWYTSSCVPHAFITLLEYAGIITQKISQLRAYRKRNNYPAEGSNGVDMMDKIIQGQSNDFDTPYKAREAMANAMELIQGDKLIPSFKYYQYLDGSYRIKKGEIINDVAQGIPVSIFIYATSSEYSREYVEVKDENLDVSSAYVRHAVTLVPNGDFTEKGVQYLTVHDSAKFGGLNLRYITKDFFMKRVFFAVKVVKDDDLEIPKIITKAKIKTCQQGDRSNNIVALQRFLIADGVLEPQYATGYYGALTSKAVLWWQLKNHEKFTANIPQLLEWKGQYFGGESVKNIK